MSVITRGRGAAAERPLFWDRNLQIVLAITATSMLGVGSLSPAFPQIMKAFDLSSQQVGLLITVYTAPGIVLSPVAGLLADRFGRKNVMVPGLLVFALTGLACALTTDFNTLVLLRFIQGLGGSPLTALNNTVIGDLYAGRRRMEAMGYNSSVGSVMALCHPLLGGAMALFGWQYPMLLPLVALPVAWLVAFRLDNPEPRSRTSIGEYLSGAAKSIINRQMLALYLVNLANITVIYGVVLVYLVVLMQSRFGASPLTIGFIVASSSAVAAVVSTRTGFLSRHLSPRQMIVGGMMTTGIGIALNGLMPSLWLLLVPALVKGLGQGVLNPALYATIANRAPIDSRAAVMSFSSTMFRTGQTFGPLAFGLFYAAGGMGAVFAAGLCVTLSVATAVAFMMGSSRAE